MNNLINIFRPSVASLGYALFLAINATVVWGGVFPFLPLSIQTPTTMLWFFLVEATVFALAYIGSVIGAYRFPGRTKRFLVIVASTPYALGWFLLIASSYLPWASFPLVVAGGALIGVGSAGFYMLWQRLFAAQRPDKGDHDLIVGTAYASILYFALHAVPIAVTALLVPLVFLPLFALAAILGSRKIDLKQPMFEDVPSEHPTVYRRVISDTWRSALGLGALGLCSGLMRAMAITDPSIGTTVNIISMGASLIAAAIILVLWSRRNVQINVSTVYRVALVIVLTTFVALPFVPSSMTGWFSGVLYALHCIGILTMMVQCAQISRDRGVNPVFIYGFFGGIMYALHDLGFIIGSIAENAGGLGSASPATMALIAVYLLAMLLIISQKGVASGMGSIVDNSKIELITPPERRLADSFDESKLEDIFEEDAPAEQMEKEQAPAKDIEEHKHEYTDRISKQVELMRMEYRLSAREAEVAELIVRGETVARIAEALFVSENTVRTHSKRIYAKLDVHKKQQLRDLVDSYRP